jgi:site-specific recombinase XerD
MSDRDPSGLSPREAVERYLRRRRADATDASVKSWKYRLKLFVEWLEGIGIERVDEIRGYDVDEYYGLRSGKVEPSTLEGEMHTLRSFLEYLEQIEAAEDVADSVHIPDVDDDDRSSDESLDAVEAIPLLRHYRSSDNGRGSRAHAFLELAWYTGARQGGLRAIDVRDLHVDEQYVDIRHRPETGTPLKNKSHGERPVALPEVVVDVLEEYRAGERYDVVDDHGRAPLLASAKGRPGPNTIRAWSYLATQPCLHSACPHGRERTSCEYVDYTHASKCPSSRSPHPIRSGSITWQLDLGIPPAVVAERVNASTDIIKQHYDAASPRERMEKRRRPFVDELNLNDDPNED